MKKDRPANIDPQAADFLNNCHSCNIQQQEDKASLFVAKDCYCCSKKLQIRTLTILTYEFRIYMATSANKAKHYNKNIH